MFEGSSFPRFFTYTLCPGKRAVDCRLLPVGVLSILLRYRSCDLPANHHCVESHRDEFGANRVELTWAYEDPLTAMGNALLFGYADCSIRVAIISTIHEDPNSRFDAP
jgi:hypothetical protein